MKNKQNRILSDCLYEIFEYLDKNTLYSCLLVNHLWCEVSVRNLWRSIRNCKTLIACLPNESKEILYNNGIIISNSTSKPPLFNYVTFIKNISVYNIEGIIKYILQNYQNYQSITPQSLNHKEYIVAEEIYKLIMNQISLKELYFISYSITIDIPNINFISYPGARDCLKCLSKLNIRSDLYPEFFYQLSKLCYNIQYLEIKFVEVISNGVTDLISVQKNLKSLIIQSCNCEDLMGVIHSLTKLPNTLIKFELYGGGHSIPLSFITNLTNLQELVLSFYIYGDSFGYFKKIHHITFPQLQILKFPFGHPEIETLIKFLEINGKNLKEFRISSPDNSLYLVIDKFCPNLRKLFTIEIKEVELLKKIFNGCQYLESIKILCGDNYKEVLETVVKYSPKNFYELKMVINTRSEILSKELEKFFTIWKDRIPQKSLSFTIEGNNFNDSEMNYEIIEVIKKYKRLGIIKKFKVIM
ncbi:hypothetical protein C1645_564665 [Glomus cerebriforme]|uniref:F-box domain-containing protein n=1 Tax=Glomus cerebriforme TaxID=658196 RepID=A0A397S953_9GLOM|nr:hypothetical protein C1645_564665 [Glomus cerebriforme]